MAAYLLLSLVPGIAAAADHCIYARWHYDGGGAFGHSTISKEHAAHQVLDGALETPGVTASGPVSCTQDGGSEIEGNATYLCSMPMHCEPPACPSATDYNSATSVYMACDHPFWVQLEAPLRSEIRCANCVADPINPFNGAVFRREEDYVVAGSSPLAFQRFYSSRRTRWLEPWTEVVAFVLAAH